MEIKNSSQNSPSLSIRDTLFCDVPIEKWATIPSKNEPWITFQRSYEHLKNGEKKKSIALLHSIEESTQYESRQILQAWHFLRQLGEIPSTQFERHVLGVIVEVGMNGGTDFLAGYSDRSVRYYNYQGNAIIWDRPDSSIDSYTSNFLNAGKAMITQIGPWDGPRPDVPTRGEVRVNILTPLGLWFGQGPYNLLAADPIGGPVISSALQLMKVLIDKSTSGKMKKY